MERTIRQVTFLGFGQAASTLARPMAARGAQLRAYDLLLEQPGGEEMLYSRAAGMPIAFLPLKKALIGAEYILSLVTAEVALSAAQRAAPYLGPGQTYVDLNSTSPMVKQAIGQTLAPSGAGYVEGAVLDAIGAAGEGARILLGGPLAQRAAADLASLGLNVTAFSPEIGPASLFKMLRSVFSKGMEALLIEVLLAAQEAGIVEPIWREIVETVSRAPFEKTASAWVRSHATAHRRRYYEMEQVLETLASLGFQPLMTQAVRDFFYRSVACGLGEEFTREPSEIGDLLRALAHRLQDKGNPSDAPSSP